MSSLCTGYCRGGDPEMPAGNEGWEGEASFTLSVQPEVEKSCRREPILAKREIKGDSGEWGDGFP